MYDMKLCLCFLLFRILSSKLSVAQTETESRVVNIRQGPVRGYKSTQHGIFEFQGIPYATAPTGLSKFKAPEPGPLWIGTFEATATNTILCPQILPDDYRIVDNIVIQEDCLIANVYVPDTEEKDLSVLVIVHGGAYQFQWGDYQPPKDMVREGNFIAVTFNYRLGINGYLCLGTEDIPGNAGSKDQVALLRWVQENIESFGGNPNDVTITGYGGGAGATELLMLSETTRGLFHKVVPESGAALAVWNVQRDPTKYAMDYAKSFLNFEADNIQALNDFYLNKTLDELILTNFLENTDTIFNFVPCLERFTGSEMFLTEAPVDILKNGSYNQLPVLIGFSEMEGIFRLGFFELWKDHMNEKFADFLPGDLIFENDEEKVEVARKVKEFYFGNEPVSNETMQNFIDYFGDLTFHYPIMRSVRLQREAGNSEIYFYEFSYIDDILQTYNLYNYRGPTHTAQTNALTEFWDSTTYTEDYKNVIKLVQQLWTSFYKTGKPISRSWPTTSANGSPHLKIDVPSTLEGTILEDRMKLWDELYEQYYVKPIPPRSF